MCAWLNPPPSRRYRWRRRGPFRQTCLPVNGAVSEPISRAPGTRTLTLSATSVTFSATVFLATGEECNWRAATMLRETVDLVSAVRSMVVNVTRMRGWTSARVFIPMSYDVGSDINLAGGSGCSTPFSYSASFLDCIEPTTPQRYP